MSSTGQIVGTVVGGVIGFFAGGNVMLGASIGGAIGGAIDPPKGPKIEGPRLDDLSVQTSTYGATIARGYGTVCLTGNIFWLEGDQLQEHTKTEESGGKGGGGTETTTYTYSATFAVGLMRVADPSRTVTLRRMWIDTNLVFDASGTNLDSTFASFKGDGTVIGGALDATALAAMAAGYNITGDSEGVSFAFFNGSDDQAPHPRMQADKGAANVSGYPGLCYVVLEDLDLTKHYSNTLLRAQVKVELVVSAVPDPVAQKVSDLPTAVGTGPGNWSVPGTMFVREWGVEYTVLGTAYSDSRPQTVETFRYKLGEGIEALSVRSLSDLSWKEGHVVFVKQSDVQCAVFVDQPGTVVSTNKRVNIIYPESTYRGPNISLTDLASGDHCAALEAGVLYCVSFGIEDSVGISKIVNGEIVATSGSSLRAETIGYSQNYLFTLTVTNSPNVTTLRRFNKSDLTLHDSTVFPTLILLYGLFVIDDDTAYFVDRGGVIYLWNGGAALDSIGALAVAPLVQHLFSNNAFYVANNAFAVSARIDLTPSAFSESWVYVGTASASQQSANLRDVITAECGYAGIQPADLDLVDLVDSPVRGYRVSNYGAIRSALEPLQAAYRFDVMQAGYSVRFVSRGWASVASIPEVDLGASSGNSSPPVLLPVSREMDSQLHSRCSVRYLDPLREYDTGEQYSERPEKTSLSEWLMDLPLIMTATEAAQTADILLSKEWVERRDFGPFYLPPTWRALQPADIITVSHRGQDYTLRLTRIEYLPDGLIACSARQTAAACYTSSAIGSESLTLGQSVVPLKGSTIKYLLDIPRIRSEQDVIGMAFGMIGKASGWPGGLLFRSDDSGNTWASCGAMNNLARVFQVSAAPSAHLGYSTDFTATLIATPVTPAAALYSVTEEQLYNQSNLAAYGIDGRWEIVSFRTVVDNTGTYTLSGFLRGLYGTQWASGLHAAGDLLIMLDTTTVGYFTLPSNALGSPRIYRAVTQGLALDSAPDMVDTYEAHNLKPLAPVDLTGERMLTVMDWKLVWSMRTRWPVEVFSGSVVPLSESSEIYDFEIYTDNSFSTLKRSFLGLTSAQVTYTQDMQFADFGRRVDTLYVKIYQISSVAGRGYSLTEEIFRYQTPPSVGYGAAILALSPSLYLKMDNTTTTFTDSSTTASHGTGATGHTTYGQVGLLTGAIGNSVQFTSGTLNEGIVNVPYRAGFDGAFTCIFLIKLNVLPDIGYLFHHGAFNVNGSQGYVIKITNTGRISIVYVNSGNWYESIGTTVVCSVGVVSHIAVTYDDATTVKIFKDGLLVDTLTTLFAFQNNAYQLSVCGELGWTGVTGRINGKLDEVAWFNSVLSNQQIYDLYYIS